MSYQIDGVDGSSDFKWTVFRRTITYECLSSSCEKWWNDHPEQVPIPEIAVSYIVIEGPYIIRAYGWYYDGDPSCDAGSILPKLINKYLNTVPGNRFSLPIPSGGADVSSSVPDNEGVAIPSTSTETELEPQTAGNSSHFRKSNVTLSPEAKARMDETMKKLQALSGGNVEVIRIKTPEGELIKVINKDVGGAKGTALSFKLKYYGNKYVLDKTVDSSIGALDGLLERYSVPVVGLFKDYIKANKDNELFQGEDAVRKTALDLHVNGRSASLYNDMSGIEERELKLSPGKNLAPSNPATKPIELTIQSLGIAVKKAVAQDYAWEFRKTAETAVRYKKLGWKYKDIIAATIRDMMEETSYDRRTQTLNAQSRGEYRDQEARIRFYINKLFEEGRI
ncbi:hypothetical protein [Thermococcus sp. GR6]|uniref:hypothetical protein n=1 Tax=Thermococcus sp. GR6 TaxID=1638256 RepID=UPI001432028B|nr:hypothetical protein [Thermococcus sp. GR6]NJE43286.1 hypothetical protein [Thermococcus sp. GR6]